MRGDTPSAYHLSSPGHVLGPPKLAPLERLPKRHRVGPSASLDEQIRNLCRFYNMMGEPCQIKIGLTFI
jgi:hypothetical protein